jgi:bifunctional non-homologous end joining protein LigD
MLPTVLPMLATPARPFDAPEYSFEVKWDGVRMLAAVETAGCRLWGRDAADYTARYPELAVLRRLPPGTLVDGECVARNAKGVPDLALLLKRHGLTKPWKIGQAWRWCAVRYLLFDLLYYRGRCVMREPLSVRRAALAEACAGLEAPDVAFSAGVVGAGKAFFASAVAQGHEGVVAKHLASAYRPGFRSAVWRKIKPHAP